MERKRSPRIIGLILALMIFLAFGNVVSAFNIGDTVEVTANLNVRTGAGTSYPEITDPDYPGYAPARTTGNVLSGPTSADGYIWWEVDYGPGLYSGWSAENWLIEVPQPPSPPTLISPGSSSGPGPEISTTTPTLQWNGVSGADYYALAISKYPYGSSNIVYNPQQVYGTSLTVPSGKLVYGEKYRWNMQAHNSAGWSSVSDTLYFQTYTPIQTPSPPRNLGVTDFGDGYVYLAWDPPSSDGGSPVTNYRIYRGTYSGGETLYTTISSDWTTFNNNANIVSGTTYYYKIKAVNSVGDSDFSNEVSATIPTTTDTVLPAISISSPSNGQTITAQTITVSGTASDNVAVSKVEVRLGSESWQTASGTTSWSRQVTLSSGSNTIYAKATDTSENTRETSVIVNYNPPIQTGTINVNTNLINATFTITGPATYSGSGTSWSKSDAPVGTYTITYGTVSEYNTPQSETKTLTASGSIMFIGTYTQTPTNPPNHPTALSQLKSDGVTSINVGGTTTESTVIFKGGVNDPDGDKVKLQIELRRLDEYGGSFTGTPTKESDWISSGSQVSIPVYGLIDGNYHWQARTIDDTGATSSWVSFGGNSDSASDFTVSAATQAELITVSIDDHSASPKEVKVGESVSLRFSFTNTGNVPWTFYAALSLRKPNGEEENLPIKPVTLSPNQQGSAEWSYPIDMEGNWDVVFGVWKEAYQENSLGHTGWLNDYIKGVTPVLQADYLGAELIPTDNKYTRDTREIRYIVIHYMDGTLEGTIDWFKRPESGVSAHYLVGKNGRIVQMVKEKDIAWHAKGFNEYSIGIEHEDKRGGLTDPNWATEEMYQSSAALVRYLSEKYEIPKDRTHIIGHSEISHSGKQDPGPYWDWDYYMQLVKGETLDTTLPTISISSPSSGQTFTTPTITVSGVSSDDVVVSKVEVRVNSGSWLAASGTTSWSAQVTLSPGSNTIYARATDASGNTKEISVIVNYNLPDSSLYQMPTKSGKISFFSSKDRTGECEDTAWGELLGEACGTDDATKYWYVAIRWPYAEWDSDVGKAITKNFRAKEWWHNKKILVTNPNKGKQVVLAAKDWGPNPNTGKDIDVSYTALKALGAETGNIVNIEFADQSVALGPIQPTPTQTTPTPKFLTLPFRDSDIKIQQGWYKDFGEDRTHEAIDYIKGTADNSLTWESFTVLAVADGQAIYRPMDSPSGSATWGNYVLTKHVIDGFTYYTVNAHLSNSPLPQDTWVDISRWEKIGTAGDTGKMPNCPKPCIHLHFEFSKDGYGSGYRLDPYDVYGNKTEYNKWGPNHFWTPEETQPEETPQPEKPEPITLIQPIIETIQSIIDKIRSLFGFS